MHNIPFRTSILNISEDLSPLKVRSYLMQEAAHIQSLSGDNGYTVIRLFMPERLRLQVTQKKLDAILYTIVNKFPAIHRIILERVERPLNLAEMDAVFKEEASIMNDMIEDIKRLEAQTGSTSASNKDEPME